MQTHTQGVMLRFSSGRQAEGRGSTAEAQQSHSWDLALWRGRLKADLTHRGTPGRRCQPDRSQRRRERTPLILQMESLRATLVTLLVKLVEPTSYKDGCGIEGSRSWTLS